MQTPTLAIVVRREQAIRAFVARDYWEVKGTFAPAAARDQDAAAPASFTALWTARAAADPDGAKVTAKADAKAAGAVTRFAAHALAAEVAARAAADAAGPTVESLVEKRSREPPPLLFDLTSLQRTANRRFGLSAARTLEVAQALYERSKLLTYPRTDSRHLPSDLAGELPALFAKLGRIPAYAPFARPLGGDGGGPAAPPRRIFDDAKVGDHHAIIPTGKVPGDLALDRDEQRIFDLVVRRFLGAFHPDAQFALTEVVIRVGAPRPGQAGAPPATAAAAVAATDETALEAVPPPPDRFVARGRVRLVAGWQEVAGIGDAGSGGDGDGDGARRGKRARGGDAAGEAGAGAGAGDDERDARLPPLGLGQHLDGRFEPVARRTRPPPRHTEATLLGAMEYAGRDIEDEALRAAMRDTGLGTPATRAATIETLLGRGFIAREGKQIVPTPTGIALIDRLPVPTLASPELTGAWEARLARVARGEEPRTRFMTDIVRYIGDVTDAIRGARAPGPASVPTPAAAPAPPPPPSGRAAPRAPARPRAAATAAAATSALACPRCRQGTLVAGKRGWGCARWREGCPFVVWFETAGKRLTAAQLRDLVEKGKTRKATWSPAPGGAPISGRLVLDLAAARERGAARLDPC